MSCLRMQRAGIVIVFFILLSAIMAGIAAAEGNSNIGDFTGEHTASVGDLPIDSHQVHKQDSDKEYFIDRDDYYFLNTGEKKSYLREEDSYVIIRYDKKSSPRMRSRQIQKKFKDRIDIFNDDDSGRFVKFKIKKGKNHKEVISELYQTDSTISFISPLLKSEGKKGKAGLIPNIIISIESDLNPDYVSEVLKNYDVSIVSKLSFTETEFKLKVNKTVSDIGEIFELARTLAELEFVKWAEPDFYTEATKAFIPDDPLFSSQWHLHNTGQNGAAVDADIDAPEGWDFSEGNGRVIAVYDDGVDTAHEDIAVWSNPGETGGGKEANGIDDDGNGYIDDYQGWDFSDNDNDPGPSSSTDNHGTSVAGVAGAVGNNTAGVSGSAPGSVILPVRMNSGSCEKFADAMRYAGKYADVVNNSWTISACESNLNAAILDVVSGSISGARRGILGTPVLFASGNNASGWIKFTLTGISQGTHSFEWKYSKDSSVSSGYDTIWLDDITWPGGAVTDFESDTVEAVPSGFTSSKPAEWLVVSDGVHARGASGKSVKAGAINHNKTTSLYSTRAVGAGALTFWAWVSSEQGYDFFEFYFNGVMYFKYAPGQYGHDNEVGYPASNPDTIAVGASNDGAISGEEERSYYSQFGSALDVVAPSSGGGQGITTTDRMGSAGYSTSNYTSSFGGTSSATPLVSGLVADIIADDPGLSADEVRSVLHEGADKIGPYPYSEDRNDHYGYGRVNLVNSVYSCLLPVMIDRVVPVFYSTLQDAYNAAADGETIFSQAIVFTQPLNIDLNKAVSIEGGYDCDYASVTGRSVLSNNITITSGTLTIGNFELQ